MQYSVRLWDVVAGVEKNTLGEGSCVAYSGDGSLIAWGGGWGQTVRVASTASGQTVRDIKSGMATSALVLSPQGKTLATAAGGLGSRLTLWDVAAGKEQPSPKGNFPWFAFSPDGRSLAVGGVLEGEEKISISIADRLTGQVRFSNRHETLMPPGGLSFSPNGKLVAATGEKATVLWDTATGKEVARLTNDGAYARALAFHPNGKALAVCYSDSKPAPAPRGIRIWDLQTGKSIKELPGHPNWGTTCLAFSRQGQLASGGSDGTVILWKWAR